MAYSIRPLAAHEAGLLQQFQCLTLTLSQGQATQDGTLANHPDIRKYFVHWGRKGDIAFVAESAQHELVGAIWSRLHITEYPGYGFIDEDTPELSMAVLPDYRRQGIGSRLLKHYLSEIKTQGYRKVSLSVERTHPAYRLYTRLGFRPIHKSGHRTLMLKL